MFSTCDRPAEQCDVDHHEPVPEGPTCGCNLGPMCRTHHTGKTFAWLAVRRIEDATCWTAATGHTYRCLDEPFPVEPGAQGTEDELAA